MWEKNDDMDEYDWPYMIGKYDQNQTISVNRGKERQ